MVQWLIALVAGVVTALPVGTDVDYQLGGPADVPERVGVVVRDRTEEPTPAEEGRYDVCYVNAFQTQPDQKRFWRDRWRLVLQRDGRPVVDSAWGEWLLDLRTPRKREALAGIVGGWVAGCADDGYDAVELDNLDSFTRSGRLLDRSDNLAYARLLVAAAHDAGLAVGQKNLAGFDGTSIGFDFVVAEECGQYRECTTYTDHYGDQVLAVEYTRRGFGRACAAIGDEVAVVRRDVDVTPDGIRRWC